MRIAIVGAGMGGLTAAATLRMRGIEVRIYEQARQFARVGAGIQQSGNAIRVLRAIGLEEKLRRVAFQPSSWANREWDSGEMKFDLTLGATFEAKYGAPYLLLHRGDLHSVLLSAVPQELIHMNRRLVDLEQTRSGVALRFEDGSTEEADGAIGADGVHSTVRQWILGPEAPRFTGKVAYRTTFPASLLEGATIYDCTKWWGPDRHIVIYFVNPQRSEIYFVTSQPEHDWRNESWSALGDMEELRAAFKGFHPQVQTVLEACPQAHKWAL
jgi:6-hydroxynicotinate 3-monooxygenase